MEILQIIMPQQIDTKGRANDMVTSEPLKFASTHADPIPKAGANRGLTSNRGCYVPFSTRWQVLALIVLGLLSCIAVLEVGMEKGVKVKYGSNYHASTRKRGLEYFDPPKAVFIRDSHDFDTNSTSAPPIKTTDTVTVPYSQHITTSTTTIFQLTTVVARSIPVCNSSTFDTSSPPCVRVASFGVAL